MRPIRVITRPGSVLDAQPPASVAAGNVETSQRITDTLLGALHGALPDKIPAASAGTMNNLSLGGTDPVTDKAFAYYETIAGGMGARPTADGMSAVQNHMTNSLNTPIEALEHLYPLRLRRYAVRQGSGGGGKYLGGDGVIREFEFLTDTDFALLSDRRETRPYGLKGGEAGAAGRNILNGEELPAKGHFSARKGDRLRIETPGGGGFGK